MKQIATINPPPDKPFCAVLSLFFSFVSAFRGAVGDVWALMMQIEPPTPTDGIQTLQDAGSHKPGFPELAPQPSNKTGRAVGEILCPASRALRVLNALLDGTTPDRQEVLEARDALLTASDPRTPFDLPSQMAEALEEHGLLDDEGEIHGALTNLLAPSSPGMPTSEVMPA